MWSQVGLSEHSIQFSSVQSLNRVRLFETAWITARQASPSITNSRSLLKLMSIKSVMPSSHLIFCRPLLLITATKHSGGYGISVELFQILKDDVVEVLH